MTIGAEGQCTGGRIGKMSFTPPNEQARRAAIGSLDDISTEARVLFNPASFQPITAPGPMDWLAVQAERGQSFQQWIQAGANIPRPPRNRIYFQPIGEFPKEAPKLETLKNWAEAFFSLPTSMLPAKSAESLKVYSRNKGEPNKTQLLTTDVLSRLKAQIPRDAFCLLAITFEDLYPDPKWNFVFGQASLQERVGVYSFVRFDPAFYGQKDANREQTILRRSCRILAHETGHMFGIQHCIYFRCVMNGSNDIEEADAQPLHLCPVDLHKLHASVRFDVVERYAHLQDFCRSHGLTEEANWIGAQLKSVRS